MKVEDYCFACLIGLAEETITRSGGSKVLVTESAGLIAQLWEKDKTPPAISNELLRFLADKTGVRDPYADAKVQELKEAQEAYRRLSGRFPETLSGFTQLSALGNSADFFTAGNFNLDDFIFEADMAKIEKAIYTTGKDVLVIGDNIGDFIFDMPLVGHLEERGKRVFYAVREGPVQNDLSLEDFGRLGLEHHFGRVISTGAAQVGLTKEAMSTVVRGLWNGDGMVIAKGMGNYETLSEFDQERPVVYIMKVKCPAVSRATGRNAGTYIAKLGGE